MLPKRVQDALWQALRGRARFAFRSVDCGVVLARPDGYYLKCTRCAKERDEIAGGGAIGTGALGS